MCSAIIPRCSLALESPGETVVCSGQACRAQKLKVSLTGVKTRCVVAHVLVSARAQPRKGGVSGAAGVQVGLRAWQEGHVGQTLVRVLGVERHGAQGGRQVSERQGHAGGAAVHHARIHEGGDGVELRPAAPGRDSGNAAGRGAEEGHAALGAVARVGARDLKGKPRKFSSGNEASFTSTALMLRTWMGKHGASWLQVWVQSAPDLKAAVLGLCGVCAMSWSIH